MARSRSTARTRGLIVVRSTGRPLMAMLKPPKQRMLSDGTERLTPIGITFSAAGAGPGFEDSGAELAKTVGRLLERRHRVVAGVDRRPSDHQADERTPPAIAVAIAPGAQALSLARTPRPLGQHQGGASEPRHPAEPECLGTFGGFLDVKDAL